MKSFKDYFGDYVVEITEITRDGKPYLLIELDRLANSPDQPEPVQIIINDTTVFAGEA